MTVTAKKVEDKGINPDVAIMREVISKLVPMIAARGIKVTQRGSQAYVRHNVATGKPELVNIPYLPDNASSELIQATQGFIDHEVGHLLYSDFTAIGIPIKEGNNQLKVYHNIVEDPFVERKMAQTFPGSGYNLKKLHGFFISNITEPALAKVRETAKPGELIQAEFGVICVPMVRALSGQEIFQEWMTRTGLWDHELVRVVTKGLSEAEMKSFPRLADSYETLKMARRLVELLFPPSMSAPETCDKSEDSSKSPKKESGKSDSKSKEDSKSEDEDEEAEGDDEGEDTSEHESSEDDSSSKGKDRSDDDEEEDDSDGDESGDAESDSDDEDEGDGSDEDDEGDSESDEGDSDEDEDHGDADDEEESEDDGDSVSAGSESDGESDGKSGDSDDDDGDDASDGRGDKADSDSSDSSESDDGGDEVEEEEEADVSDSKLPHGFTPSDFTGKLAEKIGEMAAAEHKEQPYIVYTTDFDIIEPYKVKGVVKPELVAALDDKTRHMVGVMQKEIERLIAARSQTLRVPGYRSGRLHSSSLHRLRVNDDRVFRRTHETKSRTTVVSLLIDNSGSMGSGPRSKTATAMESAYALSQTLDRLKIKHECIGFTTKLKTEHKDAVFQEIKKTGVTYARFESIYMPIYKSFSERLTPDVRARFAEVAYMARFFEENVDGECVRNAALRLVKEKGDRHILIVLSDGAPAWKVPVRDLDLYDAMSEHLRASVEWCEKIGVETIGIGIQDGSVKHYYPKNIVIKTVEDLPKTIMGELRQILLGNSKAA
jgi:hypothetical protein